MHTPFSASTDRKHTVRLSQQTMGDTMCYLYNSQRVLTANFTCASFDDPSAATTDFYYLCGGLAPVPRAAIEYVC